MNDMILQDQKHFTLVEILVAIGIILILAGITIGGLNHAAVKGDESKTQAKLTKLEMALEAFREDYGYYPMQPTSGDLNLDHSQWNLFTNRSRNIKNRPYMEGELTGTYDDAYGEPFQYVYPDTTGKTTKYRLWSQGKDRTNGTEDDITNWK